MNKNIFTTLLIAVAVIGALIGGYLVSKFKKCPEIKVGTETTLVSVTVHDTTHDTLRLFKTRKDTVYLDSSKTIKGVQNCFSFDKKEEDGAYIKAEVCSKDFPADKPADLRGTIDYQAAPDSNKIIHRVDTVTIDKTTPFYKSWPTYAVALLSILAGGYIASAAH